MAKRIIKKVILILAVSPLLVATLAARLLTDLFSEIEYATDAAFTKVGRWLAGKMGIME